MNKASKTAKQSAKRTKTVTKPSAKTTPSKVRKAPAKKVVEPAKVAAPRKQRAPRIDYKKQIASAEEQLASWRKRAKEETAEKNKALQDAGEARGNAFTAKVALKKYKESHTLSNGVVAIIVFVLIVVAVIGFAS